ncbi:MAG: hypothetical protein H7Y17_13075 [Chlorobia bacterium]|nr:hypothetical protein [Fimbriimonadaceae bacterium]
MLSLLAAVVLTQKMPDTSLRLQAGDSWTAAYTYHFAGEDIDLTQREQIKYSVVREPARSVLIAEWQLVETKTDGETIPAPKGIKPMVRKLTLDGENLNPPVGDDVARHRIERTIAIERKGNLSEPSFFPVPPYVRLVGINRIVELDSRVKDKSVLAVSVEETVRDKPLKAVGYYTLHPTTGILEQGQWTITNAPIPGGSGLCDLTVAVTAKNLKLAPRK